MPLSADPAAVPAEGVLYAEKDFNLKEHPDIPGVPNLQVGATLALLAAWPLGATSSLVSLLACSGWSSPRQRVSAACAWLGGCSGPRLCTQVIKMMQSFKSKELVTERFAWRHYYWCASCYAEPCAGAEPCAVTCLCEPLVSASRFLTDEGIEYLREYLNLPSEIVPATLKKSTRPVERNTGCVAGLPQYTLPLAVVGIF